ncbi:hypothetical protein [Proteiniborus sp. MB09-C3]|uniref:hypothetical protein n=1 Tax=Proteiniborus sp. MB09-C3 TaxID=3050072 RepID=UPI0025565CC6|nr:hypothetical protein [Proteiniborus sp. MB09-C3]WIV12000.1 hypothetical protein QO263_18185 [Proteiniborus sp. MB09-C3]
MRVGIVGPEDLVNESIDIGKRYKSIQTIGIPYEDESDTLSNVKAWENKVDAFLFTGFLPYYHVRQTQLTDKQLFYYPILGSSLYKVLFKMKFHNNINISKISIDTLSESEIGEVYKELEMFYDSLYVNDMHLSNYSREQYIEFHRCLYEEGKTEAAITSINSVYKKLKEYKVPVFKVTPTRFTMKETFKLIASASETRIAKSNQILIIIVDIKEYSLNGSRISALEMKEKRLSLYQELLNYSRLYQASVFSSTDGDEFIVLITKGIFQEYTNSYESIPIVNEIKDKFSMSINMGIGMGTNALEAEENARKALALSKEKKDSLAYMINQDKVVIGPIGSSNSLEYRLKSQDKTLLKWTEKTDISISNLTMIKSLLSKLQTDSITASDIQKGLDITLRSANRIMNKLVDGGAAVEVGVEQPGRRGRPSRVYKIDFSEDKLK